MTVCLVSGVILGIDRRGGEEARAASCLNRSSGEFYNNSFIKLFATLSEAIGLHYCVLIAKIIISFLAFSFSFFFFTCRDLSRKEY